jgi:hypothetical protein
MRLLVVVLLTGCYGRPEAFHSGQRLKARLLDGGDGARALEAWVDTALDTDCRFRTAADGVLRCLPETPEPTRHWTEDDIAYLDPACTEAVRLLTADAPLPAQVVGPPGVGAACDEDDRPFPVFELGDRLEARRSLYYLDSACHPLSAGDASTAVYTLGAEVPPSAFVSAEDHIEPIDGRVGVVVREAADGSQESVSAWDEDGEARCEALWVGGTCFPRMVAWNVGYFGDDGCTRPAAYASGSTPGGSEDASCLPTVAVAYTAEDVCGELSAFSVGAEIEDGFLSGADGCQQDTLSAGHRYFSVTGELPAGALPRLDEVRVGTGRLLAIHDGRGVVPTSRATGWYDSTLYGACWPRDFCDGTTRCVPDLAQPYQFADPACTEPVAYLGEPCGDVAPLALEDLDGDACISEGELRSLGSVESFGTLWVKRGADCVADADGEIGYRRVLGALSADTFATLVEATE